MKLFVDMDGVLADFEGHYKNVFGVELDMVAYRTHGRDNVNWKAVREHKDFFLGIPPMHDFELLWGYIIQLAPTVITGIPSSISEAADNKRAWVHKHLGPDVPVICCQPKEKYLHCKPGDILIDDWEKYKHLWVQAGGVWITHTSARATVQQLTQLIREPA